MSDSKHVIKYAWNDGEKLKDPTTWCGQKVYPHDWCFQDAQHALLAVEQESTSLPCQDCLRAIGRVVGTNEERSISLDEPPGSAAGNPDGDPLEAFEAWLKWHYRVASDVAEEISTNDSIDLANKWLHLIEVVKEYKRQGAA